MVNKAKLFLELLEAGSLPESRFKGSDIVLKTPFQTGILVKQPKGGGKVIEVANPKAFRDWIAFKFPAAFGGIEASSPRASNIAMNRDSKRGLRGLDHFTVIARAFELNSSLDQTASDALASLIEATHRWGAASIFLEVPRAGGSVIGPTLPIGARVMTIENQDSFRYAEKIKGEADVFLRSGTGGRMREALIDWLADQESLQIVHFGDFDPVGLQEFLRLFERMPSRVSHHVPNGIDGLFRRFSNREILEADNNRAVLASIKRGQHASVDRILDLIAAHGPLEQEAILINPT